MEGIREDVNKKINRDISLDAVKGFAILLVMIGHCIVLNGLADPYIYDGIAAVQMPLFMAVSGYLAGLKPADTKEKPSFKKRLLAQGKRGVNYLVPFFVWMVIVSFPHVLKEIKIELFHLDYGLWFLATLFIITTVQTLAVYCADWTEYMSTQKKLRFSKLLRFLVYCLIIFIFYVGFFFQGRSGNTFLSPSLTVRYLPFYVATYVVAYYVIPFLKNKKYTDFFAKTLWGISLILFAGLVYAFDMIVVTDTITLIVQMICSFVGVYAAFYGIQHFCKGTLQKALAYIGRYTLEIYVLHFRFARILGLENKNLTPLHLDTLLWVLAAFLVMSLLTAIFISALKTLWITDFLCFGKIRPGKKKQPS